MEISSQLNTLLESKGMSADELAEKADIPRMTIYNARKGKNVTLTTAMKIVKALEVNVSDIWSEFVEDEEVA